MTFQPYKERTLSPHPRGDATHPSTSETSRIERLTIGCKHQNNATSILKLLCCKSYAAKLMQENHVSNCFNFRSQLGICSPL